MTEAELRALAPARLDAAIGLSLHGFEDGAAVLRLEPPELAVGSDEPEYLHGGALATCVDTAAWYAVVWEREGDWVIVDLRCDFLRMAVREPIGSRPAVCGRVARSRSPTSRSRRGIDRAGVAVGRAQLARVRGECCSDVPSQPLQRPHHARARHLR